jgi:hypothetical protein
MVAVLLEYSSILEVMADRQVSTCDRYGLERLAGLAEQMARAAGGSLFGPPRPGRRCPRG